MSSFETLAERCEQATGPSSGLDDAIYAAINNARPSNIGDAQRYTASLDAAMTLVPKGWGKYVTDADNGDALCEMWPPDDFDPKWDQDIALRAKTWPLAVCAAALRARAASVDTHRMAETGTGSGRSLSGAVPNEDSGDAQPLSMTNGIEP
jgi:hypothetical protein